MVGEARRFSGSFSVSATSTAYATVRAATGEQVKLLYGSVYMAATTTGSKAYIRYEGWPYADLAFASDASPVATMEETVFIDDANGITAYGFNAASSARTCYYYFAGVKIN